MYHRDSDKSFRLITLGSSERLMAQESFQFDSLTGKEESRKSNETFRSLVVKSSIFKSLLLYFCTCIYIYACQWNCCSKGGRIYGICEGHNRRLCPRKCYALFSLVIICSEEGILYFS